MIDSASFERIEQQILRYREFPREQLDYLQNSLQPLCLAKGEQFYTPDDPHGDMAFILKGVMRHYVLTPDGLDKTLAICQEGNFSGNLMMHLEKDSKEDVWLEPLTDVDLAVLPHAALETMLKEFPGVKDLFNQMVLEFFQMMYQRNQDFLCLDSRERYLRFKEYYPNLESKIPQHYIASFLGMTPETLSRVRNRC